MKQSAKHTEFMGKGTKAPEVCKIIETRAKRFGSGVSLGEK